MDFAAANGFVIFTHDLDFGALLAKCGACQPSALVAVDPQRDRIRLLPL